MAGCSEQERGWVSRRDLESWLCLMHEVELLRVPLGFGRAHVDVTLSAGEAVATRGAGVGWRTAASKVVMRSGRHFAQFTLLEGDGDRVFGVIRPGWDVEGAEGACDVDGHSFYYAYNGYRQPDDSRWEGMQDAREQGDRIGVLLDLDRGSTTVWKNGVRLGVLQVPPVLSEEHPSGPLCWAVEMGAGGASVQIDSARAPTEEELATAKVDPEPSSESDDDDDE